MLTIRQYCRQQKGMVLIFTLILLLLISLVSASQIQQNRLQLMMTVLGQQQNQRFADAERALELAKDYLDQQRRTCLPSQACWATVSNRYVCYTKSSVFTQFPLQNTVTAGTKMINPGLPFSLTSSLTGMSFDNGSGVTLTGVACVRSVNKDEEDCAANTKGYCYSTDPSNCMTEIYSLTATMRDSTNNERTVQTRYAIRCQTGQDVP